MQPPFICFSQTSALTHRVCENKCFLCENRKKFFGRLGAALLGSQLRPHSLYQNLSEPLITMAIFRFLQNQRGVLQAKNAANWDPSNLSMDWAILVVLRPS